MSSRACLALTYSRQVDVLIRWFRQAQPPVPELVEGTYCPIPYTLIPSYLIYLIPYTSYPHTPSVIPPHHRVFHDGPPQLKLIHYALVSKYLLATRFNQ